jgi:hypothetical protein
VLLAAETLLPEWLLYWPNNCFSHRADSLAGWLNRWPPPTVTRLPPLSPTVTKLPPLSLTVTKLPPPSPTVAVFVVVAVDAPGTPVSEAAVIEWSDGIVTNGRVGGVGGGGCGGCRCT